MSDIKGIREYNRIRRYMEHIYLYGFFGREDFEVAGLGSAKDYDFGTALLRTIFPEMDKTAIWIAGKKRFRFARRYEHSGENRLANSYIFHAIDVETELLELLLLMVCSKKKPMTMSEIHSVEDRIHHGRFNLEYATSRRRFLELVEHGYLKKIGRKFALNQSPLVDVTTEELIELYSYVCFVSEITYPRVAGSFLCRSIVRELRCRGVEPNKTSECLLRRNSNRCIFDEEIVYELLDIIHTKSKVCLVLEDASLEVVPVMLRVDAHHGRWYLLACCENKPTILRISKIRRVKRLGQVGEEEWTTAQELVLDAYHYSGCSGAIPADNTPIQVEALLLFGKEQGMMQQFLREMRIGEVVNCDEQLCYRAYVNDPTELLPFLRKYSPWVKVLHGKHNLREQLKEDLLLMKENLECAGG